MGLRICQVTYPPWMPRELPAAKIEEFCPTELDLDNSQLQEYYEKEMPNISKIKLKVGMNHEIANALTSKLMECLLHEDEWKNLAYEFGYRDEIINSIPYKAKLNNSHPFYFFLSDKDLLKNVTWGDLVNVFLKEERYDLLETLYPYIFDIKRECNRRRDNSGSLSESSDKTCSEFRNDPHTWTYSQESSGNNIMSIEDNTRVSFVADIEPEYSNNLNVPSRVINDRQKSIPFQNNVTRGIVSLEEFFKFGKAKEDGEEAQVTIFISHTSEDYELASQVAKELRRKGFVTFVQGDEDASLFRMGEGRAVKKIKETIDFFVPIVTREYLRQIEVNEDSDIDQSLVRYIFHTYQGQFVDDQCVYRYIKPLVPEGVEKKYVKKHVELRLYMNLWKQFDRFCNLLIKTKASKG